VICRPKSSAQILGGRIVMQEHRRGQWIAVIAIEQPVDAKLAKSVLSLKNATRTGYPEILRAFVCRGSVRRRQGDIIQPVVNAQLRAVVDDVIEHHGTYDRNARHGKEDLSAREQGPRLHEVLVAGPGQRGAKGGYAFVKFPQELLARGSEERLKRRGAYRSEIQLVRFQRRGSPTNISAM